MKLMKKNISVLCVLIASIATLNAQIKQIEINPSNAGCGNSINSNLPSKYDDWTAKSSWSATIYDKMYFSSGGEIKSIAYFTDCKSTPCSYNPATNQKIYIGLTDVATFTNANRPDNDNDISNLTLVYSGNVQWQDGVWNTIDLTSPFNYDKTKNLVIYFVNQNGGNLNSGFMCDNPSKIIENIGGSSMNYSKYANNSADTALKMTGTSDNAIPITQVFIDTTKNGGNEGGETGGGNEGDGNGGATAINQIGGTQNYFSLSPNPLAKNKILNIHLHQNQKDAQLVLYNMLGKTILNQTVHNQSKINLNHLAKGVYFIRLDKKYTQKLFIK